MPETTMDMTRDFPEAEEEATAPISHRVRRVWLAALGAVGVAREQFQSTFEALERKGEQLEPSMIAPFKRASATATHVVDRAGQSVLSAARAVGHATTNVTRLGARADIVDLAEELDRIVEEKLGIALERLDLPSRTDFQELRERIEELAANKPKRPLQHGREETH